MSTPRPDEEHQRDVRPILMRLTTPIDKAVETMLRIYGREAWQKAWDGDQRHPQQCPKCGNWCLYDGWDHTHGSGISIGHCQRANAATTSVTVSCSACHAMVGVVSSFGDATVAQHRRGGHICPGSGAEIS